MSVMIYIYIYILELNKDSTMKYEEKMTYSHKYPNSYCTGTWGRKDNKIIVNSYWTPSEDMENFSYRISMAYMEIHGGEFEIISENKLRLT